LHTVGQFTSLVGLGGVYRRTTGTIFVVRGLSNRFILGVPLLKDFGATLKFREEVLIIDPSDEEPSPGEDVKEKIVFLYARDSHTI
jgi:hypothetical protein